MMTDEIELKLSLTNVGAAVLVASGLFTCHLTTARQRSIYFDTPGRALEKAGLLLRIRKSGDKRIQTIKAQGASASGLFVRPEWEREVNDDTPVLDDTTPVPSLLGKHKFDVAPRFIVDINRGTWMVGHDDSVIELVIDCGEVEAGERSSPICEVELELRSGKPDALFALARQIDLIWPVRLGVLTKAERGYRLAEPLATIFRAEPIVLTADLTAAQAFQRIVQSGIRHYRLNEDVLLVERSPEALHQCRVALRRLRSAFVIFKPAIGGAFHQHACEELRWLAAELGNARELDVLIQRAETEALVRRIEIARTEAYAKIDSVLNSSRPRSLMLDLAEWAAHGEWLKSAGTKEHRNVPIDRFAAGALTKLRRRVKKGGRDLTDLPDSARHQVRKDAKKLRYAAEFFKSLCREKRDRRRYKRFVDALEDFQDTLGTLNDLVTTPCLLEKLGLADQEGAADMVDRRARTKLLKDAAELYGDLIDVKRFWR